MVPHSTVSNLSLDLVSWLVLRKGSASVGRARCQAGLSAKKEEDKYNGAMPLANFIDLPRGHRELWNSAGSFEYN